MTTEEIHVLIQRLEGLYAEAREIEEILYSLGLETGSLLDQQALDRAREHLARKEKEEAVCHALARMDFRDDYYSFLRAIDGDTIVFSPPSPLKKWMKDLHVRLYGLETPELWEEHGDIYRHHLEELCAIDGNGRLMIIWERERRGTNYEGFPLSSFERGIGHLFIPTSEGEFYYVNGLMHLLRYSTLTREGRSLLRGRRKIGDLELTLAWRGGCASPLKAPNSESSQTFRDLLSHAPSDMPPYLSKIAGYRS